MTGTAPASFAVAPGGVLHGLLTVPGDKSISHRVALLGALAEGETRISGFLRADDCLALLVALTACGVTHRFDTEGDLVITGRARWQSPLATLDLGNSGTALRLLMGVVAGQPVVATFRGDASLSRRPMERIAAPLRAMGALIETTAGCAPLTVHGQRPLTGIEFTPAVASAQVKSAVLFAGLAAAGPVVVHEAVATRDHSERALRAFGVACVRDGERVELGAARVLHATRITVPGDFSSAAFFIIGAAMTPGSTLTVEGVGLNPSRTAALDILRAMGADLTVEATSTAEAIDAAAIEPVGRITVRGGELIATTIDARLAAQAIDELPMLMVAAATARGTTRLSGAAELQNKESDRLATTAAGLAALGIEVELQPDGMVVQGGSSSGGFQGGTVDACDDHRIAMAFAMAALRSRGTVTVERAAAIATSFPSFHHTARAAGLRLAPAVAA